MAGKTVNQTTAVKGSEVWSWASKEQEEAWKYGPKPLCLSGGYGCVAAGTRIFDPVEKKHLLVEEIKTLFHVAAMDTAGEMVTALAFPPFLKGRAELFKVVVDFNAEIIVTDEHKFMTALGWMTLKEIRTAEVRPSIIRVAIGAEFQYTVFVTGILSIESVGEGDFYDLHVPIWNNYLAEGLVNHNSGKTMVACRKILRLMDAFPGYRVVVARRRWVHLVKTTMATFFKVCKPEMYSEGRRSDSEKILRLNNGSELIWMHLEDGEEVANIIPGLEINALFIDQAEEVDEELYDKLSSRLGRWDRAVVPDAIVKAHESLGKTWKWFNQMGQIIPPAYNIIACNPDNEMHWIYRRFHPDSQEHYEKKIPEYDNGSRAAAPKPTGNFVSYHDLGYKMITMSSTSNKYLTKQNISALLVNDESFIKRYVRGEWGSPEGSIHVIHPSSLIPGTPELVDYITRNCRLFRVMDYGDSAPTCVAWGAVDKENNAIIYREYYEPDRLISDHRIAIDQYSRDKDGFKETYTFNLADPSIFHKMPQAKGGRWCVADEYKNVAQNPENAIFWNPADNNELGTRNRINEYLRLDPKHTNPFTREKGAPHLYFITKSAEYPLGCSQIVKQTRSQRRLRLGTELGKPIFSDERDDKIVDHAYDVVRYFIASRPPAAVTAAQAQNPMSFAQVRLRTLRFHKRKRAV